MRNKLDPFLGVVIPPICSACWIWQAGWRLAHEQMQASLVAYLGGENYQKFLDDITVVEKVVQ